jgi:hypothetical protein
MSSISELIGFTMWPRLLAPHATDPKHFGQPGSTRCSSTGERWYGWYLRGRYLRNKRPHRPGTRLKRPGISNVIAVVLRAGAVCLGEWIGPPLSSASFGSASLCSGASRSATRRGLLPWGSEALLSFRFRPPRPRSAGLATPPLIINTLAPWRAQWLSYLWLRESLSQ